MENITQHFSLLLSHDLYKTIMLYSPQQLTQMTDIN